MNHRHPFRQCLCVHSLEETFIGERVRNMADMGGEEGEIALKLREIYIKTAKELAA